MIAASHFCRVSKYDSLSSYRITDGGIETCFRQPPNLEIDRTNSDPRLRAPPTCIIRSADGYHRIRTHTCLFRSVRELLWTRSKIDDQQDRQVGAFGYGRCVLSDQLMPLTACRSIKTSLARTLLKYHTRAQLVASSHLRRFNLCTVRAHPKSYPLQEQKHGQVL